MAAIAPIRAEQPIQILRDSHGHGDHDWPVQIQVTFVGLVFLLTFSLGCYTEGIKLRLNGLHAQETMKKLRAAEATFKKTRGEGKYGTLKELVDSGLVHDDLAGGVWKGYRFEIKTDGNTYEATAVPLMIDDRQYAYIGPSFYLDETGIIRAREYGRDNHYRQAGKNDSPIPYQE